MKNSMKQTILMIICILIIFIPTYIAITYYLIKSGDAENKYVLDIKTHTGDSVSIANEDVDSLAELILKMNSNLSRTASVDENTLPKRFYDMTVSENGSSVRYRYYFSIENGERTLVKDSEGNFYSLEFSDVKKFLSGEYAFMFYDTAIIPSLSIAGGSDILPREAKWQYKAVDNTYVDSPLNIDKGAANAEYLMSGKNRLEFSTAPDKCTVNIYLNNELISSVSSLDDIPYELLDSDSLYLEISAEWTGMDNCRGSAKYRFFSTVGGSPEFFMAANSFYSESSAELKVQKGEFFTVVGKNISAPQKISFTSVPELGVSPVFFAEGEYVYALIPIPGDPSAPLEYTFTFAYSGFETEFEVSVTPRNVLEREYDNSSIGVDMNAENLAQYRDLLSAVCAKHETVRYFSSDKFIDFETYYEDDSAILLLGYGNKRIPTVGDPFTLDGVDFVMSKSESVRSIEAGKVIASGSCKLLGNYIVVDHGFGLKTWYCHLSNSIATVGSIVKKGEAIGTSGSTGYTNSNGVYLITTILDVPVCPYTLQENGMIFPQINK